MSTNDDRLPPPDRTGPTIVVGYDGSQPSRAAFDLATRRAGPTGLVVVVHAFKLPAGAPPGLDFEDRIAERHAHARPALEALLVVGDDAVLGTAYEIEVLEGSPAPVIAELTACWGADEIIVGARGLGCSHAVLGSVARELLQMADRPVTVVPNAALDQLRNGSSPSSAGDAAAAALV